MSGKCSAIYYMDCPNCDKEIFVNNGDENDLTVADVETVECCYCQTIMSMPEYDGDTPTILEDCDYGEDSYKSEEEAINLKSNEEAEEEKKHVDASDIVCPYCFKHHDPEFSDVVVDCIRDDTSDNNDICNCKCTWCGEKFTMTYVTVTKFTTRKACRAPVGTCSVCGQIQYDTPSGPCCENGHGGAPSVEDEDE